MTVKIELDDLSINMVRSFDKNEWQTIVSSDGKTSQRALTDAQAAATAALAIGMGDSPDLEASLYKCLDSVWADAEVSPVP